MLESRIAAAAPTIAHRLYICGGWFGAQPLSSVECYDPEISAWMSVPMMSMRRSYAVAAATSGQIYVFGGYSGEQYLSSVEYFDPLAGRWMPMPAMLDRRWSAMAVTAPAD